MTDGLDIAAAAIRRDANADLNPTTDLERAFARGRVQGLKEALGFVQGAKRLSPARVARGGASYVAGAAASFASGGYAAARLARTTHAVVTGRIGPRLVNIAAGRAIGRAGIWRR